MYTIFHNPRCSKSRQGLEILENAGVDFEIREYLKEGQNPEISELKNIQKLLGFEGRDIIKMIRIKEKFWAEILEKGEEGEEEKDIKKLISENSENTPKNNQKILELLVKFPRGLERPILIQNNEKAVMGRPPENFLELL